ncbi:MAG TPA: LPS export ABC transporter periplasmic protein LptC [Rhodospirillales bacterium]|nr:LPS export ABC transporter periplasmic protein LptC [Rhodospirillales bacterium]
MLAAAPPEPPAGAATAHAERERRHRVIRVLRIALPVATAGIIILALFWPQLIGRDDRIDVAVPVVDGQTEERPEAIVNATYSGVDREGRPFAIRAKSVRNPAGEESTLQLAHPDAQIALKDGSLLTIEAESGLYRRDHDALDLQGRVTLRRGADLTVQTEQASIDLAASSASGDQPVGATSVHGTLTGTGFRIADGGDTVLVMGPARMQMLSGAGQVLP